MVKEGEVLGNDGERDGYEVTWTSTIMDADLEFE